jgi:hypothetical protein
MRNVFDPSSDESTSDTGALSDPELPTARPKRPSKRGQRKEYRAWICKTVFDCDLFCNDSTDGLIVEEKTKLLKEHLRTRLQHDLPRAVLACAVLVDSSAYFCPPARLSIPVTFYVQTKNTTVIPLEASPSSVDRRRKRLDACARWTLREPRVRRRHEQTSAVGGYPSIHSKLALNDAGRRAKRVIARF